MTLHLHLKNTVISLLGFTPNECITVKHADSDTRKSRLQFGVTRELCDLRVAETGYVWYP